MSSTKSRTSLRNIALVIALSAFTQATHDARGNGFTLTSNSSSPQTISGTSSNTGTVNSGVSLNISSGSGVPVTISGGTSGSPSTLINNGTIEVTGTGSARAVQSTSTNSVVVIQNNAGATIYTINNDTIAIGQGSTSVSSVSLTNAGTIQSDAGGQAVNFNKITNGASNSVTNSGLIKAVGSDAVRPGVNGSVSNTGTIVSTQVSSSSSDGVDGQTNSGISIVNAANAGSGTGTGTIEGGRHGVTGGNTAGSGAYSMSITNNLGGAIQGDNGSGINIDGINGNELVTIVNHGTITGNGHDIGDGTSHDGDGVDVDGLVNLTNTGSIKSLNSFGAGGTEFSEGVTVGGGTITNSGTIEGSVASGNTTAIGRGITIAGVDKDANDNPIPIQAPYGPATITNSGLIKGDSDSAIIFSSALSSGFSHMITNQAGGVIQTGSTTAPAILTAADAVTINNSGTIDGSSSGKAITGGAGNLTVNISGSSPSVLGDIAGGSGTNSMSVDPGASNAFSYSGSISNFNTVTVKSGTVTFTGDNTYTGQTNITGGNLVAAAAGALASTASISIASGATLQLAGTGDRINDNAALSMAGNFNTAGLSETVGTLSLAGNSIVDLGAGNSILRFANSAGMTWSGTLSIYDYTGSALGNGTDQVFFGSDSSGLTSGQLGLISFYSGDGTGFLGTAGILSDGEIVPESAAVPEPSTKAAGTLFAIALVWRATRRKRTA